MKFAIRCALSVILLFAAGAAYADGGSYVVKLTNGNVLTANSYRIERGRVYLKYPIGEAAIKESLVLSIETEAGVAEYFQSQGELVKSEPKPPEIGANPAPKPAVPIPEVTYTQSQPAEPAKPKAPRDNQMPEDRKPVSAAVAPQTAKIDKFVDDYFSADENTKALMDQNIDDIFSGFFEEPPAGK